MKRQNCPKKGGFIRQKSTGQGAGDERLGTVLVEINKKNNESSI